MACFEKSTEKQHLLHQSLFSLFVFYTPHLQTTNKLSISQRRRERKVN